MTVKFILYKDSDNKISWKIPNGMSGARFKRLLNNAKPLLEAREKLKKNKKLKSLEVEI